MTKPTARLTTSARVTVTLEVETGSWGPGCDLAQVYQQASESAIGKIRHAIVSGNNSHAIRIVKVNAVEAVTTDMEKR